MRASVYLVDLFRTVPRLCSNGDEGPIAAYARRRQTVGPEPGGDLLITKRKEGFLARSAEIGSVPLCEDCSLVTSVGCSRQCG